MTASCQRRKRRSSLGVLPQSKTRRWELLQCQLPGHPSLLLVSPHVPWAQTLPRTPQNPLSVLRVSVCPRTCQTGRESPMLNWCLPESNSRYLQSSRLLCPQMDRTPCNLAFMPEGCTEAPHPCTPTFMTGGCTEAPPYLHPHLHDQGTRRGPSVPDPHLHAGGTYRGPSVPAPPPSCWGDGNAQRPPHPCTLARLGGQRGH